MQFNDVDLGEAGLGSASGTSYFQKKPRELSCIIVILR